MTRTQQGSNSPETSLGLRSASSRGPATLKLRTRSTSPVGRTYNAPRQCVLPQRHQNGFQAGAGLFHEGENKPKFAPSSLVTVADLEEYHDESGRASSDYTVLGVHSPRPFVRAFSMRLPKGYLGRPVGLLYCPGYPTCTGDHKPPGLGRP